MDFAGLVLETLRRASHRVLHCVFSAPGYWEDQFEYIDIAINKDIYIKVQIYKKNALDNIEMLFQRNFLWLQ